MNKEQELPESDSEIEEVLDQALITEEVQTQERDTEEQDLSIEELKAHLEQVSRKADENWDKVIRVNAEMENLKKRTSRDLENAHKFGLENFARELLPVIDSLELGIQAATGDSPDVLKLREGSELTIKQFEAVFAKFNIETIDPLGETFNPEQHQAMSMQPTMEYEPNTVISVLQKGFLLNGRLIRPAMVIVSKAVEKTPNIDKQA